MTACVNRKHTKKVAAVVTASLVGALSLGAAPVAAMADTDTGIETLASNQRTGVTVTASTDGRCSNVSNSMRAAFAENSGKHLVPTEVTNSLGDVIEIDCSFQLKYTGLSEFSGLRVSTGDLSVALSTAAAGVYCVTTNHSENNGIDPIAFKFSAQNTTSEIHDYIGDLENTETLYTGNQLTNIKFTDEYGADVTPVAFSQLNNSVLSSAAISSDAEVKHGARSFSYSSADDVWSCSTSLVDGEAFDTSRIGIFAADALFTRAVSLRTPSARDG